MFLKGKNASAFNELDVFGRLSKHYYQQLLRRAGITIGGNEPWDIQIRDARFWRKVGRFGTLGFGEVSIFKSNSNFFNLFLYPVGVWIGFKITKTPFFSSKNN